MVPIKSTPNHVTKQLESRKGRRNDTEIIDIGQQTGCSLNMWGSPLASVRSLSNHLMWLWTEYHPIVWCCSYSSSSSASLGLASELRRQLMSDNDLVSGYIITSSLSSKALQSVTFSHTFNQANDPLNCVLIKRYLFIYSHLSRNWMSRNGVVRRFQGTVLSTYRECRF